MFWLFVRIASVIITNFIVVSSVSVKRVVCICAHGAYKKLPTVLPMLSTLTQTESALKTCHFHLCCLGVIISIRQCFFFFSVF